jgi:hypothetical protein
MTHNMSVDTAVDVVVSASEKLSSVSIVSSDAILVVVFRGASPAIVTVTVGSFGSAPKGAGQVLVAKNT